MKNLLGTTTALILAIVVHAQVTVKGTVKNNEHAPLQGATITITSNNRQLNAISNANGSFVISNVPENTNAAVTATYINKQSVTEKVIIGTEEVTINFTLPDASYTLEPLEVRSTRASDKAPFTKTNIYRTEINKANNGQDLPFILNQTPSVVVNSDAGNGVGYTGIHIRGTDGTRINVTLNGIPYNDAESGGSYFVDLPDFASSVGSIQVQRGVGTSTNGAGAFGATINLSTNELHDSAYAESNNSFGSFNTWKNTIRLGSGLLNNHFTVDARLSRITSDGFVDRANTNLQSAYFSAAYIGKKTSLRFNIFTGKEKTYQAWNGVPQAKLFGSKQDLQDYYSNNVGSYYFTPEDSLNLFNSNRRTYNLYTYANQTDNYQQDHYQLFFNQALSNTVSLNIASFLSRGRGYYEEYKYGQTYAAYGLPDYVAGQDTITSTDLVRQRWLDNYFYGQTFSLQYKKLADEITFGGSWTKYDGKHYGNVIWANAGIPKDYQYYSMPAYKTDMNVYAKWLHTLGNGLNVFGDIQYRHVMHDMQGFEDAPTLFIKRTFDFYNPKAGISYTKHGWNAYASYALAHKEPNRDDFQASETDQPTHETLHDFEAGISGQDKTFNWGATLYYMLYRNQLVLTGQINDVGAYTRTNVPNSYRAGVELQAGVKLESWLDINAGATFSRNKIKSFTEYLDDYDGNFDWKGQQPIAHHNTDIAFSPNIVANGSINIYPVKNLEINLLSKYVSKQYLDNTQSDAKSLRSYFTEDVRAIYTFKHLVFKEWSIAGQLNNVFNKQYESNGYTFGYYYNNNLVTENYYFPMAGTYGTVSVNISF